MLIVAALFALSLGEPSSPWLLNRQIGYAGGGGYGVSGDLTRDMGELEQRYRLIKMIQDLGPVLDTEAVEKYATFY